MHLVYGGLFSSSYLRAYDADFDRTVASLHTGILNVYYLGMSERDLPATLPPSAGLWIVSCSAGESGVGGSQGASV